MQTEMCLETRLVSRIHVALLSPQVQVGEDEFIHVRVYQDLQQQVSLSSYQTGKKEIDPIEYF